MTQRTGRPVGRPKTKEYVTLMARVPQELADRVQHYARLHQQPISVVLRDGLELLLEEDRYHPFVSDSNTRATPALPTVLCMSDRNPGAEMVSDRKEDVRRPAERQAKMVSDRKADRHTNAVPTPSPGIVSYAKGDASRPVTRTPLSTSVSDTKGADIESSPDMPPPIFHPQEPLGASRVPAISARRVGEDTPGPGGHSEAARSTSTPPEPTIMSDTIRAFDATRYTLGELCIHRHNYHGTAHSLRRLADRECLECHAARARAYRQRQRQGATPTR